ncbi:MAG: ClbS/DfsB family four-helix bundle protein [Anaerolineae bacterium]|nr:ClbS/DfsB family four-helix bundle protein [Anaerolineae bacterium]
MSDQSVKIKILEKTASYYDELDSLLAKLKPEQITQKPVAGVWTLREVLINLSYWQQRLIGWLDADERGEEIVLPDLSEEGIDMLNAVGVQEKATWGIEAVLEDFKATHNKVLTVIGMLNEDDLTDKNRYPWMQGNALGPLVRACTYAHYMSHKEHFVLAAEN